MFYSDSKESVCAPEQVFILPVIIEGFILAVLSGNEWTNLFILDWKRTLGITFPLAGTRMKIGHSNLTLSFKTTTLCHFDYRTSMGWRWLAQASHSLLSQCVVVPYWSGKERRRSTRRWRRKTCKKKRCALPSWFIRYVSLRTNCLFVQNPTFSTLNMSKSD